MASLGASVGAASRGREGFFLSWSIKPKDGHGRNVVWIDNGVAIRIRYTGSKRPEINRDWAESLALAANTNNGLVVTEEKLQADE